jgi:hypothetical protein
MVETKGDTLAYNPYEEATGIFQIRPIRLKDYNKECADILVREMRASRGMNVRATSS